MFILQLTEVLPLIEFQLEDGITDEEAIQLLQSSDESVETANEEKGSNFQTLLIEDSSPNNSDLFTATLVNFEVKMF